MLLTIAVYWPGLMAWFQKDDFAWLSLRWSIHGGRDLASALFAPHTEGTIRPWSHAGYFLAISPIFGVHAFPFRVVAFLTQFANLALLSLIATKLTGSRAAGFGAAILWTVNSALATAMSWIMAYNVTLCAFFLLLAFWLFLRYVETRDWRYYAAQFAVFVLGFGALETNLVYPALVGAYTVAVNRKLLGKVVPLFLVSLAYTAFHLWITPAPTSGPYHAYFDCSIFSTFWMYWKSALGPFRLTVLGIWSMRWPVRATIAMTLAIVGFLICRLLKRDWVVVVFPVWFVATLAPVLPLREQFMMQYLTIPTIGLAMWGAAALVRAWQSGVIYKSAATLILVGYLAVSVPVAVTETRIWSGDSQWSRHMVLSMLDAMRKEPGTLVLLAGVDDRMFHRLIYYMPFGAYGMWDVFVTPETRDTIHRLIDADSWKNFLPDPESVRRARDEHRLQVLDIGGDVVRDITAEYEQRQQ